jgi:hypothetical protein
LNGFESKWLGERVAKSVVIAQLAVEGPPDLRGFASALMEYRNPSAFRRNLTALSDGDPTGVLRNTSLNNTGFVLDETVDGFHEYAFRLFEGVLLRMITDFKLPDDIKKSSLKRDLPLFHELLQITGLKKLPGPFLAKAIIETTGVDLPPKSNASTYAKCCQVLMDSWKRVDGRKVPVTEEHVELTRVHFADKSPTFTSVFNYVMREAVAIEVSASEEESDDDSADDSSGDSSESEEDDNKKRKGKRGFRSKDQREKKPRQEKTSMYDFKGVDMPTGVFFSTTQGTKAWPGHASSSAVPLKLLANDAMGTVGNEISMAQIKANPQAANSWVGLKLMVTQW